MMSVGPGFVLTASLAQPASTCWQCTYPEAPASSENLLFHWGFWVAAVCGPGNMSIMIDESHGLTLGLLCEHVSTHLV